MYHIINIYSKNSNSLLRLYNLFSENIIYKKMWCGKMSNKTDIFAHRIILCAKICQFSFKSKFPRF